MTDFKDCIADLLLFFFSPFSMLPELHVCVSEGCRFLHSFQISMTYHSAPRVGTEELELVCRV